MRHKHSKSQPYDILESVFDKTAQLNSITSVLHWDTETSMPARSYKARADQISTLESVIHAVVTDDGVAQLLDEAEETKDKLDRERRRNLELMRRSWKEHTAVPVKLRKALTQAGGTCCAVWKEARAENDFKKLQPHLEKVVSIVREIATEKSAFLACTPYEALADSYDPGRKEDQMDAIFKSLKERIPGLVQDVCDHQAKQKKSKPLSLRAASEQQHIFVQELLQQTGLGEAAPTLNISSHPFCSGEGDDIRITARYDETNVLSGIMALMHESGHALYEYQLPRNRCNRPIDSAGGMALHESQSLLMEMQLCRTPEFAEFLSPRLKKGFNSKSKALDPGNLYRVMTKVDRGLIRVDADEVTYPAHVLVRYYIERYLINGDMEVSDIPDAWKQGYEKFLGAAPTDDRMGCMQDIHWMDGSFGYFPSYTIGAMYAACIGDTMRKSLPGLTEDIREGNFLAVKQWLNGRVHRYGSALTPDEIIAKACGTTPDVDTYIQYLQSRYLSDSRDSDV